MSRNDISDQAGSHGGARILKGTATGGLLGAMAGLFYSNDVIRFANLQLNPIIALTLLGLAIGGAAIWLMEQYTENRDYKFAAHVNTDQNQKLLLNEEKLDIIKRKVQTGEVSVHKEVITEEKSFSVPVSREELVIEKKAAGPDTKNIDGENLETIRIPLTEEQVDVAKRPVTLEDVSIHSNVYQETQHIEENLKKEAAFVETDGDVKIIDKKNE